MTQWLISLVGTWGLPAIFVTMAGESAGLPISSEIARRSAAKPSAAAKP